MKKQWFAITIAIVTAMMALLVLFWLVGDIGSGISTPALAAPLSLTVTAVNPDSAPNDIDAPIVIHGSGFTASLSGTQVITALTVYLGAESLPDVIWANTSTLSATVPWGMAPQVYTLTVVNPDGISATLSNAFTVTEGFGEFVTGGPYGGQAVQLALNPGVSSTVYATMWGAGMFISEDSAGNWAPIHDHDWPIQLDFDSQNPNVLYFGADSNDLYRSMDNGANWTRIAEDFHTTHGCFQTYPAVHPTQAGHVYFGMGGCGGMYLEPGEGGVFYSTDYGDTWISRTQGLSDLNIKSLAVHPNSPDTLLAGTGDGDLFYSTNGGISWTWSTQLTGTVTRLYFNPYETLEVWAATNSESEGRGYLYRSTNLTDWTTLNVNVQPGGGSSHTQMAFLPESVWLASQSVYSSTDSGANWNALSGPSHGAVAIAIPSENPQIIYVGTDFGVEKSTDGGATWQEVNEGLAALLPNAVAVSPDDPDTVYVKTHQGIFVSHNGGNGWLALDYGIGGFTGHSSLAVDAFTSTRLYLNTGCQNQFCIDISPDEGATWTVVTGTLPPAYVGWSSNSFAITPSPHTPGRVLVGASLSPPGSSDFSDDVVGIFYRSDDYGVSWSYITLTQTISHFTEIVYDAFNPDLIYAGTEKTGLWRSTDGGDNWTYLPISNTLPPIQVSAIAVHPNIPDKVYLRTSSFANTPNPEPELWVSEDAGDTWQPLTYVFLGVDLLVSPPLPNHPPYTLYTGCEAGLCRSTDDGLTWTSLAGVPRPEILRAASDGERSIIYLGAPGGLATSAGGGATSSNAASLGDVTILGGGVYRLTTRLPTNWVYLPLVLRGYTP